jgi:hypothetical protein
MTRKSACSRPSYTRGSNTSLIMLLNKCASSSRKYLRCHGHATTCVKLNSQTLRNVQIFGANNTCKLRRVRQIATCSTLVSFCSQALAVCGVIRLSCFARIIATGTSHHQILLVLLRVMMSPCKCSWLLQYREDSSLPSRYCLRGKWFSRTWWSCYDHRKLCDRIVDSMVVSHVQKTWQLWS